MHLETEQVAVPTSPARLRCVWVASEDQDGTHLTAHWIDDRAERREARLLADPGFGEKAGETCWRITLYFVWGSH
jgi:hypothetical protein